MSIQVFNNSALLADPSAEKSESQSAPAAPKATEQTEVAKSDTAKAEDESKEVDTETEEKDESDAEESDEETEAKDADQDKPKKKSGSQRRKERAERAEADAARAREEADHWKAMALKNAGEPKPEPKADATKAVDASKPIPDSFETHAEYVEALTDWKIEQRDKARDEKAQKSQLETEHQMLMKSHFGRLDVFKEKTEDFEDVISGVLKLPMSPTVEGEILRSENGPELLYALAKDPAEFKRINALGPVAAGREIGKLEAKLAAKSSNEPKPETKKLITKAPNPISPVGGKGSVVEKSLEEAAKSSQREYEDIRKKQMEKRASW